MRRRLQYEAVSTSADSVDSGLVAGERNPGSSSARYSSVPPAIRAAKAMEPAASLPRLRLEACMMFSVRRAYAGSARYVTPFSSYRMA